MTTYQEKIANIKLNPNNPRLIKDEKFLKLVKSIQGFPDMLKLRPIVVNDDLVVLGGNMRLKACKEAGMKEVPVIKASDLTEEQQREFIIKDNISFGENDWEMINADWPEAEEWGLDIPGFSMDCEDLGTDFTLPNGDKAPFQQMTFTLADEQATVIKKAIDDIKATDGTQCGDGTIYRASGFILTNIVTNKNTCKLTNGEVIHKMTLESNPTSARKELNGKSYYQLTGGKYDFTRYVNEVKGTVLTGYQLRYVLIIDKGSKLNCPILPFSKIDEIGAGMYKGKKITIAERQQNAIIA